MCFKFLHYIYDQEVVMPKAQDYYSQLLNDENFLTITPQIFSILKQKNRLAETPDFFQEKLKGKFKESFYQNLFIQNQMNSILQKLEEKQIEVIPLKGVTFSEKYFGHVGARPTSDIDLLIKEKDMEEAIHWIKELGFYIEEPEIEGHFHLSFSKELPGSIIPLTVELHWDILPRDNSALDIIKFWEDSKPIQSYQFIKELTEQDLFYMICLHSWRHNLDSIKHYLDIVHLIASIGEHIDYDLLIEDAARHKTLKRMIRTLSIVYQECPFLDQIKPFPYKKESPYLSFEDKTGKKVNRFKRYMDFVDYQFLSYDNTSYSLKETIKWVKSTAKNK